MLLILLLCLYNVTGLMKWSAIEIMFNQMPGSTLLYMHKLTKSSWSMSHSLMPRPHLSQGKGNKALLFRFTLNIVTSPEPPSIRIYQYFYWNLTTNTDDILKILNFGWPSSHSYTIYGAYCKILKLHPKYWKMRCVYSYWNLSNQVGGTASLGIVSPTAVGLWQRTHAMMPIVSE